VQKKSLTILSVAVIVVLAGVFSIAIAANKSGSANSCSVKGPAHTITIKDSKLSAVNTSAKKCDTLTIRNLDPETREIGFGEHDHHTAYDGISERLLRQGESFTITLRTTGEYHFHDHFHDEVAGAFDVR
jgi:hypothetical protein